MNSPLGWFTTNQEYPYQVSSIPLGDGNIIETVQFDSTLAGQTMLFQVLDYQLQGNEVELILDWSGTGLFQPEMTQRVIIFWTDHSTSANWSGNAYIEYDIFNQSVLHQIVVLPEFELFGNYSFTVPIDSYLSGKYLGMALDTVIPVNPESNNPPVYFGNFALHAGVLLVPETSTYASVIGLVALCSTSLRRRRK